MKNTLIKPCTMKKIGLITVLYNSDNLLEDFFISINKQTFTESWVYFIDNTPSPDTRNILKKLSEQTGYTKFSHFESVENIGVAAANNIGIKQALTDKCEYILLLNNDLLFTDSNLISTLLSLLEKNSLDIIVPKIYYYGTNQIWFGGGQINLWKAGATHTFDKQEDIGQADTSCFCSYAPTTFMLIKSKVFDKVPTLDDKYFIYVEDLDFVHRASTFGFKIWYEASVSLYHKVSSTTGGILSDIGFYYNTRNRIYFSMKYLKGVKNVVAVWYVFISLLYHAIRQKRATAVHKMLKGFLNGFTLTSQ